MTNPTPDTDDDDLEPDTAVYQVAWPHETAAILAALEARADAGDAA